MKVIDMNDIYITQSNNKWSIYFFGYKNKKDFREDMQLVTKAKLVYIDDIKLEDYGVQPIGIALGENETTYYVWENINEPTEKYEFEIFKIKVLDNPNE